MYSRLSAASAKRRSCQCPLRVGAGRIPEHEASRVLEQRGLNLVADVCERVRPPQREVLQPRDQVRPASLHLLAEIAERIGDRGARVRVRVRDAVLAGTVVGGIDHRVDRVDEAGQPTWKLTDAEVAGRRQPEDVGRYARTEWMQPLRRVPEEERDGPAHRLRMSPGVADLRDVAVTREADVVELDLVEPRFGCSRADPDGVAPDATVVRVRRPEGGVVDPERAVGAADRERRLARRENRILERDDATDQVDARRVHLPSDEPRVVVALRGSNLPRERDACRGEADLAVLVLDVDLERVESLRLQRDELVEL